MKMETFKKQKQASGRGESREQHRRDLIAEAGTWNGVLVPVFPHQETFIIGAR